MKGPCIILYEVCSKAGSRSKAELGFLQGAGLAARGF